METAKFDAKKARQYVRERVAAELGYKAIAMDALRQWTERIAELIYRNRSKGAKALAALVEEAIAKLKADLEGKWLYMLSLALEDAEDGSKYGIAVSAENGRQGAAVDLAKNALNRWTDEKGDEIAAVCSACIASGKDSEEAKRLCLLPYWSEEPQQAIEDARKSAGWIPPDIAPQRKTGQWRDTSRKIESVAGDLMSASMMWALYNSARGAGVETWRCRRGSSYPCAYCDDECSYTHTLADPMPPFHSHCCCYAVPIYI